ncbi:MAG: T9SS type A sorting domain-containing protein [Bacteroidetes bacterium]|nr:T9SS type A sorting domain-containing protein [Bacteroidota bacterium]
MKRSLLSLTLLAALASASAQTMLVKDINPGTGNSNPVRLTAVGKRLIFAANDGTNGNELWYLDSSGASIAYNINPAAANAFANTSNRNMAVLGKYIYFPADNGTSGTELYKWDGVVGGGGPMLAAEIYAGTNSANVDEVITMGGKVYFDAFEGTYGEELYAFDTATNTAMRLTDISSGSGSSFIQDLTVYNNKLYFCGYNPSTGQELYCYDPATNNTTLVLDIESGFGSSIPNNMVAINNKLYFTASTTANGRELYVYNGTNVQRISDLVTGSSNGVNSTSVNAQTIIGMGGMIYFSGNDATTTGHLYKYDPATGINSLIYKTNPTGNSGNTNFAMYAGKIFFNGTNTTSGAELWMYNGTGVPSLVADIRVGTGSGNPAELCVLGNSLYFSAFDSISGTELYKFYDSTLSVQNVSFNGDVKVYPNPATTNVTMDITLKANTQLAIRITDVTGKQVFISPAKEYVAGDNKVNIPVSELPVGTYIYALYNNNGVLMTSGRMLKQ